MRFSNSALPLGYSALLLFSFTVGQNADGIYAGELVLQEPLSLVPNITKHHGDMTVTDKPMPTNIVAPICKAKSEERNPLARLFRRETTICYYTTSVISSSTYTAFSCINGARCCRNPQANSAWCCQSTLLCGPDGAGRSCYPARLAPILMRSKYHITGLMLTSG